MIFEELATMLSNVSEIDSSYSLQKISKDGLSVSCFKNNTCFYSLYKPLKDVSNFLQSDEFNNAGFIITGGLGNAYHIKELVITFPESVIVVVEDSYASYKTLLQQNDFSFFLNIKTVHFCTIDDLEKTILNLYKPALHGSLVYKSIRSWTSFHHKLSSTLTNIITHALNIVSSDFSVQSHFGKIWMRNIRKNYAFFEKNFQKCTSLELCSFPIQKPAAIVAAGPSLDKTIHILKTYSDSFFIIAVDTALEILSKHEIKADVFVTIDGQNISSSLFTNIQAPYPSLALIDLSAHPNALEFCAKHTIPILLCSTGHPLSAWLSKQAHFLSLSSGSGTVTMTALDFAVICGFKSIVFFGADFSYTLGKPYAKGTYLDTLFLQSSERTKPIEMQHTALMFRTEINKIRTSLHGSSHYTYYTPVLNFYKKSLLQYIASLKQYINFYTSTEGILPFPGYTISNETKPMGNSFYTEFLQKAPILKSDYRQLVQENFDAMFQTLLPYYAWYLKRFNLKPSKSAINSFKILVKKQFDNYTNTYHES